MSNILVIDDEATILKVMTTLLKLRAHDVVTSQGGEAGKALLLGQEFDLLITDVRMPVYDGLQFLQMARDKWPRMPVIIMTGFATLDSVQQAIKLGVFDYIKKPLRADDILGLVDRGLEYGRGLKAQATGIVPQDVHCYLGKVVAFSEPMKMVCELAKRVAPTPTTILLCGEKGVGKSSVARAIHDVSRRQDRPFLSVDCAGIPEPELARKLFGDLSQNVPGLIREADGGTLFMEHIDSIGPAIQRLLVVLLKSRTIVSVRNDAVEETPVDVRLLTSTEAELQDLVEAGLFLEELYDRLRLIPVVIPPLRERAQDVSPILHYLLRREAAEDGGRSPLQMEPAMLAALESHTWPGNGEEMRELIRHLLRQTPDGGKMTLAMLPESLRKAGSVHAEKKPDDRYRMLRTFLYTMGKPAGK